MLNCRVEPPQREASIPSIPIKPARRVRRSPYSHLVEAAGVSGWTTYNHMLLPTVFASVEEDYRHLKRAVQVWDVAAERQVEVTGPDAQRLVQALTPRNVSNAAVLKCLYAPLIDERGGMLNDPLILRPDEERWWLSIADSDVLLLAKGFAAGRNLDVEITEPDVHPLAVQGPNADTLMARVFGDDVRKLRFFGAGRFTFEHTEVVVSRSGWSGQGGFELFVEGWEHCEPIWQTLFEAGRDLDVRAGCPNAVERIEAGLLSYGNDMTINDDPYQCGLGRYVDLHEDCIGTEALRAKQKPERMLRGVKFDTDDLPPLAQRWIARRDGSEIGYVTSAGVSPDFGRGIGVAMLDASCWEPGTQLSIDTPIGDRSASVAALPMKP